MGINDASQKVMCVDVEFELGPVINEDLTNSTICGQMCAKSIVAIPDIDAAVSDDFCCMFIKYTDSDATGNTC